MYTYLNMYMCRCFVFAVLQQEPRWVPITLFAIGHFSGLQKVVAKDLELFKLQQLRVRADWALLLYPNQSSFLPPRPSQHSITFGSRKQTSLFLSLSLCIYICIYIYNYIYHLYNTCIYIHIPREYVYVWFIITSRQYIH